MPTPFLNSLIVSILIISVRITVRITRSDGVGSESLEVTLSHRVPGELSIFRFSVNFQGMHLQIVLKKLN